MKIGYALGGGAARGLSHIGVLKVLEEFGIFPDVVCGVSIGAVVGALYASRFSAKDIEKTALGLNWAKIVSMADITMFSDGFVRGKRVMSLINEVLGSRTFSELHCGFACGTTDIVSGEEIVLTEGSLADAVRASYSIPGVFKPVYLNGRYLVDGGLKNVVPVSICRTLGADYVIGVNVIPDPTSVMCRPKRGSKFEICELSDSLINSKALSIENRNTRFLLDNEASGKNKKTQHRKPTLWEVMSQTLTITQYQIAKENIKDADVAISPKVEDIGYWQFHRGVDAIFAGEEATRIALQNNPDILNDLRH